MVRCGDSSSSEVWRYGVVVGAALAGVAEAGLAARDRERFSRGRACDGVFLDDGAMMAVRGHGFLVDGGLERESHHQRARDSSTSTNMHVAAARASN